MKKKTVVAPSIEEIEKQQTIEMLWLLYYNDTLLKHGLISDREHQQMKLLIYKRKRINCSKMKGGAHNDLCHVRHSRA